MATPGADPTTSPATTVATASTDSWPIAPPPSGTRRWQTARIASASSRKMAARRPALPMPTAVLGIAYSANAQARAASAKRPSISSQANTAISAKKHRSTSPEVVANRLGSNGVEVSNQFLAPSWSPDTTRTGYTWWPRSHGR